MRIFDNEDTTPSMDMDLAFLGRRGPETAPASWTNMPFTSAVSWTGNQATSWVEANSSDVGIEFVWLKRLAETQPDMDQAWEMIGLKVKERDAGKGNLLLEPLDRTVRGTLSQANLLRLKCPTTGRLSCHFIPIEIKTCEAGRLWMMHIENKDGVEYEIVSET